MLFQLLDRSKEVASLGYGSQFLWEMYRTPSVPLGKSHVVDPEEIGEHERRVLAWTIRRIAGSRPYLDKFPRMVLRADYLHALYPDARFVYIVRDGRAATSSLITGWRTGGKFGKGIRLPLPLSIEGYAGDVWKFLVPPGWEAYTSGRTLAEVCAFQWAASNRILLDARDRIGPERFIAVRYEDLVADPVPTTKELLGALELHDDPDVLERAATLHRNVTHTAVTAPKVDKWRHENPGEVESVLDQLAPTMERLGYVA
jgi:hypothetical protein